MFYAFIWKPDTEHRISEGKEKIHKPILEYIWIN